METVRYYALAKGEDGKLRVIAEADVDVAGLPRKRWADKARSHFRREFKREWTPEEGYPRLERWREGGRKVRQSPEGTRGRPPAPEETKKEVAITVRVTTAQAAALGRLAEDRKTTIADVVRDAIDEAIR